MYLLMVSSQLLFSPPTFCFLSKTWALQADLPGFIMPAFNLSIFFLNFSYVRVYVYDLIDWYTICS